MARVGRQTYTFDSEPRIIGAATVAGKAESAGPLGEYFDIRHDDDRLGMDTWEHAEQALFDEAANAVLQKTGLRDKDIDVLVGGDLNAQLSGFYFGLRTFSIPALGVYSACATFTQGVLLSALLVDAGYANRVLTGTSSHNSSAERQFRFPTEYGAQKPPTAQRTVTGAGAGVIGRGDQPVAIVAATVGKVIDPGIISPWEMGAAMAPAAADTILTHLRDTGRHVEDFDCIATGDLGRVGHHIVRDLLARQGVDPRDRLTDCGMLIYREDQPEVFSGGSGGACANLVTFGYFLKKLESGEWRRVLVSATGALLSAVSSQQKDSIPSISHAVVLERRGG
jgi:stage V sporulation protein AD